MHPSRYYRKRKKKRKKEKNSFGGDTSTKYTICLNTEKCYLNTPPNQAICLNLK